MDVWKQRQNEAIKIAATLESRVDSLKSKRQRVIDAFLHERLIDKSTSQEQLDLLNEEIALAELEIYDTKIEELDIEAALNFATSAQVTPLCFGLNALPIKNRGFKECFSLTG